MCMQNKCIDIKKATVLIAIWLQLIQQPKLLRWGGGGGGHYLLIQDYKETF